MRTTIETELIEGLTSLVSSASQTKVYEEAVAVLHNIVEANLVKFAKVEDDLLTPIISTNGGNTGPTNAVPVASTIPGSVYSSGNGCVIDDLLDVRGCATVSQRSNSSSHGVGQPAGNRSMLCVPVGLHGVLVACHQAPSAFDDNDLTVATAIGNLADHVASTLVDESASQRDDPNELLEEISRIVSHDVTNKVAIAKGHLELVRESGDEKHLNVIDDTLDNIQTISEMVVTIARSGQVIDEFVATELGSTAETVFGQLDSPDADLEITSSNTIVADKKCLHRILDNLFRNAVEHTNGSVRIEVGVFDGGFFIADDGPGIPKGARHYVFKPGFTTKSENDGSGLSIVKVLAEAHGWAVAVTESHTGGTRVEFTGVEFGKEV